MELQFDVIMAMKWLLFLAIFPMAFVWFRRTYRIFVKKDYSEVALKRGESPPNPEKWAFWTGSLNLMAGLVAVGALLGVVIFQLPFDTWSAMIGVTLWMKICLDYVVSRQAHPWIIRRKDKKKAGKKA